MNFDDLSWEAKRGAVLAANDFTCAMCGGEATQADHIWPRAYGGEPVEGNLQALCKPCNQKKSDALYISHFSETRAFWTYTHYRVIAEKAVRDAATWWRIMQELQHGVNAIKFKTIPLPSGDDTLKVGRHLVDFAANWHVSSLPYVYDPKAPRDRPWWIPA